MDFKQLEAFVTVVDEGSFSSASDRLKISQSMVTIHVRNLESELGTRLLNRTTRTMELSGDGRTFYDYARRMLKMHWDSLAVLKKANQDVATINILIGAYSARGYLPGLIQSFKQKEPEAHFKISVCGREELTDRLADSGEEFAFSSAKPLNAGYQAKQYGSYRIAVITPDTEKYRALRGQSFPVDWLGREPLVARASQYEAQQEFVRWVEQQNESARMHIAVETDDPEILRQSVKQGIGIAVIPDNTAAELAAEGGILAFPVEAVPIRKLNFIYKKKYLTPIQTAFRDFVLDEINSRTHG